MKYVPIYIQTQCIEMDNIFLQFRPFKTIQAKKDNCVRFYEL